MSGVSLTFIKTRNDLQMNVIPAPSFTQSMVYMTTSMKIVDKAALIVPKRLYFFLLSDHFSVFSTKLRHIVITGPHAS